MRATRMMEYLTAFHPWKIPYRQGTPLISRKVIDFTEGVRNWLSHLRVPSHMVTYWTFSPVYQSGINRLSSNESALSITQSLVVIIERRWQIFAMCLSITWLI